MRTCGLSLLVNLIEKFALKESEEARFACMLSQDSETEFGLKEETKEREFWLSREQSAC